MHSNVIYTDALAHSMHFHSFETYRTRVAGPVLVVRGGREDGAALPRVGDLALVARGERRGGEEGVGHDHSSHSGPIARWPESAFQESSFISYIPELQVVTQSYKHRRQHFINKWCL